MVRSGQLYQRVQRPCVPRSRHQWWSLNVSWWVGCLIRFLFGRFGGFPFFSERSKDGLIFPVLCRCMVNRQRAPRFREAMPLCDHGFKGEGCLLASGTSAKCFGVSIHDSYVNNVCGLFSRCGRRRRGRRDQRSVFAPRDASNVCDGRYRRRVLMPNSTNVGGSVRFIEFLPTE